MHRKLSWLVFAVVASTAPVRAQQTMALLGLTNTVWKCLEGECPDGAAWAQPDFDDRAWASGLALLAFEENPAITSLVHTVLYSPSLLDGRAVYFRTYFNWTNPTVTVSLEFSNHVDDCAAIYLNGNLLTNAGVSGSPFTCTNFGRAAIGGEAVLPEVFRIPATLRAGLNVLAAEVHQMNAPSADVVWGCALSVVLPRVSIRLSGSELSLCWTAEKGIAYRVEHCLDMSAGRWTIVRDCLSSGEATAWIATNFHNAPTGFYRIAVSNCVIPP